MVQLVTLFAWSFNHGTSSVALGAGDESILEHAAVPHWWSSVSKLKNGVVLFRKKWCPLRNKFPTPVVVSGVGKSYAMPGSMFKSCGNCPATHVALNRLAMAPICTGMLLAVLSAHV
jgi:hypothetical protein